MIGKTEENPQLNVFRIPLVNVINMKHELVELAQRINWKSVEKDFASYYADMGRSAVPVRKMETKADPGCHLFCPEFTDRKLDGKICHCTDLLKNKTC